MHQYICYIADPVITAEFTVEAENFAEALELASKHPYTERTRAVNICQVLEDEEAKTYYGRSD